MEGTYRIQPHWALKQVCSRTSVECAFNHTRVEIGAIHFKNFFFNDRKCNYILVSSTH